MDHVNLAALIRRSWRRAFSGATSPHQVVTRVRRVPVLLVGVGVLGAIKALDAATTVLGLTRIPGAAEHNPLVTAAISLFGLVPGLCVVALGSVLLMTVLTELVGYVVAGPTEHHTARRLIRVTGFGSAALVSLLPVASNVLTLLDHGVLS